VRFNIRVRKKGSSRTWSEGYDYPTITSQEEAETWARNTIADFNADLRPNEAARELIDVTLLGPSKAPLQHDWDKTNLVTIIKEGSRPYDTYACTRCGAQGKRFGLDSRITPDKGVSQNCQGSSS
jgi:hypothetical protein